MPAPAFGFSVGDFIAATKLIVDVSKALKDAGGASDEYRSLLAELELLQNVLTELQSTSSSRPCPDGHLAGYARQQYGITLETLSEFLSFISKFDAKLGSQAPSGKLRGAGRKAQWAVVCAKEVEKKRLKVEMQLHTLTWLLQWNETKAVGTTLDALSTSLQTRDAQLSRIEQAHLDRANTLHAAMEDIHVFQTTSLAPQLENIAQYIRKHDAQVAPLPQMLDQDLAAHQSFHGNILGRHGKQTAKNTEEDRVAILLLKLMNALLRSLAELIAKSGMLLPHLLALTQVLATTLRREPMLVVSDSINFEDVLGRKFTLQYNFYRHWPNFEAFLRRQFRHLPGERQVATQKYLILDSRGRGLTIPQAEWQTVMTPGRRISMSVEVSHAHGSRRLCSRPGCLGKLEIQGDWWRSIMTCPNCDLTHYPPPEESDHKESGQAAPPSDMKPPMSWGLTTVPSGRERTTRGQDQTEAKLDEESTAFRRIHVFRTDDGALRGGLAQWLLARGRETRPIGIWDSGDRIHPVMALVDTDAPHCSIAEVLVNRLGLRCFPCPPSQGPGIFAMVRIVGTHEGPRIPDILLRIRVVSRMEGESIIISRKSLEQAISLLNN